MEFKIIHLNEGKYVVQVQAMKKEENELSAMAPYLSNNSIITKESGEIFVTLKILEEQIITGLQIKNDNGEYTEHINFLKDEEAKARYENFQLESFQSIHHARVQYEVNHEGEIIKGDEELRLVFDDQSVQNVDDIQF